MKRFLLSSLFLAASVTVYAQVGIGTTTPNAFFNVADAKDVLFGQNVSNAGKKLIWYADKSAFRVGAIDADQWDLDQVGVRSFGIGYNTLASAANSFAIGFRVTSSGNNSTAMGNNVSTNGFSGSMILGDFGGYVYGNNNANEMVMRFQNGYTLYTSSGNPQSSASGVRLAPFGNAWQTLSDSTTKENFRKTDGAAFLKKISSMRLGSWNYKGQDLKKYRHYGPMAQEFFAAFGHDELGVIGEERSINQADFDGVNMIAIQALIKEVELLKAENSALKSSQAVIKERSVSMEVETASLKTEMQEIRKQLASLSNQ